MPEALKKNVREFMIWLRIIESQMDLLRNDRKELFESYKDKIDPKTLRAALSIYKIRQKNVGSTDAIDEMVDILDILEE